MKNRIKTTLQEFITEQSKESNLIECDKCEHSWEIEDDDNDPYLCHNCGYNNDLKLFELDKLKKWREDNMNDSK